MKRRYGSDISKAAILATMLLVLLACNFPGLRPTPDFDATAVVRTVSARQTNDASDLATSMPRTGSPGDTEGTATATGTQATATASPQPCDDRARYIIDVTIPDGTYLAPGAEFEKIWRLLNAGTCLWTSEYDLVFDSGNLMGGDLAVPLPGNVVPGSTVDIVINLTAPLTEGSHESNWMLRNDRGVVFGLGIQSDKNYWVRIIVGSTPTPSSTPTETPTPTDTPTDTPPEP